MVELFSNDIIQNFLAGLFFSVIISIASFKLKFLSKNGIITLFILALVIFTFGSWKWTIPILLFFITSSLLSKINKESSKFLKDFQEKSSVRDYIQVLSNGGLAGILVIINYFAPSELLFLLYVIIIASVTSDTWATELGTIRSVKTYNILTLKPIEQGLSGGISLQGLSGAFLGSFIISLSALLWINTNQFFYLFIITFGGFAGSLVDSILGASIQSLRKCPECLVITEKKIHCNSDTINIKGVKWFNNDLVNLTSSLAGGLVGLVLFKIFRN